MESSSLMLLLVGGLISLVSAVAGIFISHWLEMRRLAAQITQHPTEVIYNKQTEFFGKVVGILDEVNGYISEIDVWLAERGEEARRRLENAAGRSEPVTKFLELMQRYYMYLPEKLLDDGNTVFFECLLLGRRPTEKQAQKCLDHLFALQNTIREVVGIDAVSRDLFKAFGSAEQRTRGRNAKE